MHPSGSLSPACMEPAGRGSAAGCPTLQSTSPGPLSERLIHPMGVLATAPAGGHGGEARAGVASEVHSTGSAEREPA